MKPDVYIPKHGIHLFDEDEFNKERDCVRLEYLFRLKEKLRDDTYLNKLLKNGVITGNDYVAIKNAIEEYIESDIESKIKLETIKKEARGKSLVEIVKEPTCDEQLPWWVYALKYGTTIVPEPERTPKRESRIEKYFLKEK